MRKVGMHAAVAVRNDENQNDGDLKKKLAEAKKENKQLKAENQDLREEIGKLSDEIGLLKGTASGEDRE